jgi:RNA polymerase sigma factor (sigma-70 family)
MIATRAESTDRDLVEAVRAGDDCAFEELYRRYQPRIAAFVRRKVGDPARAEDIAQDVFFSALRRLRATDAEIDFKPWVFQIASNAAIDHWRRTSRAEEISVDADEGMRQSDRVRLTGAAGPDSVLVDKERFEHLRGAFDELSDMHTRILVMREFEGLSYREIAEQLDVSRGSVESTLFRARRRLESEYEDISEGRRCVAMRGVIARISEGVGGKREVGRLARHARRCHVCRRRARELGVDPLPRLSGLSSKAAAFLPLPLVLRRGGGGGHGVLSGLMPAGGQVGAAVAERAAAIVAAAAIAGAGGIAIGGGEVFGGDREAERTPAGEQRGTGSGKEAGTNRSSAERNEVRPGAGGSDPRGGGPRSGQPGGGGRSDRAAAGAAGGAGAEGSARGTEAPGAGADGVGLPGIPDVSPGAGGPSGPSADLPRLPEAPSGPGLPEAPSGPRTNLPRLPEAPSAPRVEEPQALEPPANLGADSGPSVPVAPPSVPAEPPATPELPQLDPGGGSAP